MPRIRTSRRIAPLKDGDYDHEIRLIDNERPLSSQSSLSRPLSKRRPHPGREEDQSAADRPPLSESSPQSPAQSPPRSPPQSSPHSSPKSSPQSPSPPDSTSVPSTDPASAILSTNSPHGAVSDPREPQSSKHSEPQSSRPLSRSPSSASDSRPDSKADPTSNSPESPPESQTSAQTLPKTPPNPSQETPLRPQEPRKSRNPFRLLRRMKKSTSSDPSPQSASSSSSPDVHSCGESMATTDSLAKHDESSFAHLSPPPMSPPTSPHVSHSRRSPDRTLHTNSHAASPSHSATSNASHPTTDPLPVRAGCSLEHRDSTESVVDVLYENQRGLILCGMPLFSAKALGNLDPAPWTNAYHKPSLTDIRTAQVPDPSWQWVWPEWRLDTDGEDGEGADKSGWEYSFMFSKAFSWHPPRWSFNSCVRRRAWIRKRCKRGRGSAVTETEDRDPDARGRAGQQLHPPPHPHQQQWLGSGHVDASHCEVEAMMSREASLSRSGSIPPRRPASAVRSLGEANASGKHTVLPEQVIQSIHTVAELTDFLRFHARLDRERLEAVEHFLRDQDEHLFGEGAVREGAVNEGIANEGTINEGTINEGTVQDGSSNEVTVNGGTIGRSTVHEGTAHEGTAHEGLISGSSALAELSRVSTIQTILQTFLYHKSRELLVERLEDIRGEAPLDSDRRTKLNMVVEPFLSVLWQWDEFMERPEVHT